MDKAALSHVIAASVAASAAAASSVLMDFLHAQGQEQLPGARGAHLHQGPKHVAFRPAAIGSGQASGGRGLTRGASFSKEAAFDAQSAHTEQFDLDDGIIEGTTRPFEPLEMELLETRKKFTVQMPSTKKSGCPRRFGNGCTNDVCHAAMMNKKDGPWSRAIEANELVAPEPTQCWTEAEEYLRLFHEETKRTVQQLDERLRQVHEEITATGTYKQTYDELAYGCKVAWRNSSRCINRIQWNRMEILDKRSTTTSKGMFDALVEHLKLCVQDGVIVTTMTIGPQLMPGGSKPLRFWNGQAFQFAGYKQSDGSVLGDPANVELTSKFVQLGWTPPENPSQWDLLPIAIQPTDAEPCELFELPPDVIRMVPIRFKQHPELDALGLKWPAIPLLSAFVVDIGGILYPCCPFNGWFMETEVARDLGDVQRYNCFPKMAALLKMEMINRTLWKDKCQLILCEAILESFSASSVSIVDHQTASDSFIRFYQKEIKTRGHCPGDWVWLVPPVGGSTTGVFHQEMINYQLKPMYRLQPQCWLDYNFEAMKALAEAKVKEMRKSASRGMRESTNVMILFATETGKSEGYAYQLKGYLLDLFPQAKGDDLVIAMDALGDPNEWLNELANTSSTLFIVTSTCGSGDPPGQARDLLNALKAKGAADPAYSKLRYAVFGLGSRVYRNFNACALAFDAALEKLGAFRLLKAGLADETEGEEQCFRAWASELTGLLVNKSSLLMELTSSVPPAGAGAGGGGDPHNAGAEFSLVQNIIKADLSELSAKAHKSGRTGFALVEELPPNAAAPAKAAEPPFSRTNPFLAKIFDVVEVNNAASDVFTVSLDMSGYSAAPSAAGIYAAGDRLAVYPWNDRAMVQQLLVRLGLGDKASALFRLTGKSLLHERPPPLHFQKPLSYREAFGRFLSINSPPSQLCLGEMAMYASNSTEAIELQTMAGNQALYQSWVQNRAPTLLSTLTQFPSVNTPLPLLIELVPTLQPRMYSISSAPSASSGRLDLTIGRVSFRSAIGDEARFGTASHYLTKDHDFKPVSCYLNPAVDFHLPADPNIPIVMIACGTGIAPFRSFWQSNAQLPRPHKMILIFGVRDQSRELYREEITEMVRKQVIALYRPAYSRSETAPRKYVQDVVTDLGALMLELLTEHHGRIYVCGALNMAKGVQQSLIELFKTKLSKSHVEALAMLQTLQQEERYLEDVFGDLGPPKPPTVALEYKSMYDQLGGRAALTEASNRLYDRIVADKHLAHFFTGIDMSKQRQKMTDMLSMLLGGEHNYQGKDLRKAHAPYVQNMGMNDTHFDAVAEHVIAVLKSLNLDDASAAQVLKRIDTFRSQVMGRA